MVNSDKTTQVQKETYICGHKNPDTDSICSAIAYAWLKNHTRDRKYIPCRAGKINNETKYVLDTCGEEFPRLLESVKTQVKDIEIRQTEGVERSISIKNAWKIMQEKNVVTLPCINSSGMLEGLITVNDIARSYMNVYDSSIMSKAKTRYLNIIDTLEGLLIAGNPADYFESGKVVVSAANREMMGYYIDPGDLVILGNRKDSQKTAIEEGASCLIICEGSDASEEIREMAGKNNVTIIMTAYDAFTVSRLINQSIPISYFMKTGNLITFGIDDTVDDIREVMTNVRHRDFPVLDHNGKYLGMISRRNLLGAKGKRMILVDHNEKSQAVDGIEEADVVEIIDHHRLGTFETIQPVIFRAMPLGCTATIVFQMFRENNLEIPEKIAALLCSAILSDTLLFRSPTCTDADRKAAGELAKTAGLDVMKHARNMFAAGSSMDNKTDEEIFFQDYKKFTVGDTLIGIGQVSSMDAGMLIKLKDRMLKYMQSSVRDQDTDVMYLMLTDILNEDTTLLCAGEGAEQLAAEAFHMSEEIALRDRGGFIDLPGVVSRKKQLVPALISGAKS